eukprot:TRINITY_DN27746_c0_g1_i4.p1 TRINITY_DN27746_c0_g1~~TRINITY_DN27746_c0_g1_i4.p1  ORF type:complete len:295 (-),score=61.32 TRINITY_DN27746_c0_g1_i4:109-993(-)
MTVRLRKLLQSSEASADEVKSFAHNFIDGTLRSFAKALRGDLASRLPEATAVSLFQKILQRAHALPMALEMEYGTVPDGWPFVGYVVRNAFVAYNGQFRRTAKRNIAASKSRAAADKTSDSHQTAPVKEECLSDDDQDDERGGAKKLKLKQGLGDSSGQVARCGGDAAAAASEHVPTAPPQPAREATQRPFGSMTLQGGTVPEMARRTPPPPPPTRVAVRQVPRPPAPPALPPPPPLAEMPSPRWEMPPQPPMAASLLGGHGSSGPVNHAAAEHQAAVGASVWQAAQAHLATWS